MAIGEIPDGCARNAVVVASLTSAPRGVAVNGELRAAQTVRLLNLTAGVEGTAKFLESTVRPHAWRGIVSAATSLAIQAIEVTYDPNGTVSRGLCSVTGCALPAAELRLPFGKPDAEDLLEGPLGLLPGNSAVRRSRHDGSHSDRHLPWQRHRHHRGEPVRCGNRLPRAPAHCFVIPSRTICFPRSVARLLRRRRWSYDEVIRFNDSIVVDRADGQFNMQIIKPVSGAVGQLGSSLPITVESPIRRPATPYQVWSRSSCSRSWTSPTA